MIEQMKPEHAAQVAALEKLCFSDPWSEASILRECSAPYSLWLVWVEEGKVLGYVGSQAAPPEADVMNLAVSPSCRRSGLGRALMQELMHRLCKQGMEVLFLEVRASNVEAKSLYESLGFCDVGCRKKYYVNPTEDALIYRRELKEC